jgi:hypothetical protein
MKSDTAQPPDKSALDFGWEDQNGLSPVYFVGQIFGKICCVHVKVNLRVLRVVFVLNNILPALSYVNVKGLVHVATR